MIQQILVSSLSTLEEESDLGASLLVLEETECLLWTERQRAAASL